MADFHAADLWVAVIPDTKQVGPAMEKAGKDAKDKFGGGVKGIGKAIHDELDKVGDGVKDAMSKAGKTASGHFSDEFKTGVKDVGKVIIAEYGPVIGEELGKAIGGAVGDALHDIPGVDKAIDVVRQAAQYAPAARDALGGVRDAINSAKVGDFSGALGNAQRVLHDMEPIAAKFGIDIKGWEEPLGSIAASAESFGAVKDGIMGIAAAASPEAAASVAAFVNPLLLLAAASAGIEAGVLALGRMVFPDYSQQNPLDPRLAAQRVPGTPEEQRQALQTLLGGSPPPAPAGPPALAPGQPGFTGPIPVTVVPPPSGPPQTLLPPLTPRGGQTGGPINGPGAIGKDSVLMYGAPGEHMLTADEVSSAGGHQKIYAIRALMKAGYFRNIPGLQGGGAVPIIQNSDGTWTSPDPAWAHLIQRESGGRNIIQSPSTRDVNTGGNEAFGIFQITPKTWTAHGGQGSVYNSTPQQQAIIAARIFQTGGGSDWGAGIPGRESATGLRGGLAASGGPDGGGPGSGGGGSFYRSAYPGAFAGPSGGSFYRSAYPGAFAGGPGDGGGGGPSGSYSGSGGGGNMPIGTQSDPVYVQAAGGGPGGGGPGGGADQQYAATQDAIGQQFGGSLVTGALQALGIDGSVFKSFTGKGPLDWGITKLGTGILNWGMHTFMGGGQSGGGTPSGVGGGALSALGLNIPSAGTPTGGGAPGGGDIHHNYNGTFGGLNVTQNGVQNGPQDFSNVVNSSQYANQINSGIMAGASVSP